MEQALSVQDEKDKNQMQLMGGGKQLKLPELDPTMPEISNFRTARNSSCLTTGMAMSKLTDKPSGPVKGLPMHTTQ